MRELWSDIGQIWSGQVKPLTKFGVLAGLIPNSPLLLNFSKLCPAGTPSLHSITNDYYGYLSIKVGVEAVRRYKNGELVLAKVISPMTKMKDIWGVNHFTKAQVLIWSELDKTVNIAEYENKVEA